MCHVTNLIRMLPLNFSIENVIIDGGISIQDFLCIMRKNSSLYIYAQRHYYPFLQLSILQKSANLY